MAKREKLKSVHFPHRFEYKDGVGIVEDEGIFDFVDFKVCKDLKKVTFQMIVKMPPLPQWVIATSVWFDPYNKPESFGPENIVELRLTKITMDELEIPDESSIELVTKKMTHLEKLRLNLYAEDNIDFIPPLLNVIKGLRHCHSLHELEIGICQPEDTNILR